MWMVDRLGWDDRKASTDCTVGLVQQFFLEITEETEKYKIVSESEAIENDWDRFSHAKYR